MHELQVTERILQVALKHAAMNSVSKIVSIQLRIGELSDLENEWIQQYFDHLSKDTLAAGAVLRIERSPVVMRCDTCTHAFQIDIKHIDKIVCPECEGDKCTLTSGREYYIKDMEVL